MNELVIENARVFCAVDEEVIESGTIWVSHGIIRYAGPSSDFKEEVLSLIHI